MATYTTADVQALFNRYGVPVASPTETEAQRLQRITQQLNAGDRDLADVEYWVSRTADEIAAGTHYSVTGNTAGFGVGVSPKSGGLGAAELQNTTGGNAQVWFNSDTGLHYLVYTVPGTSVPLMYTADSSQLSAIFGGQKIVADRTVTTLDTQRLGGILAGTASDPYGNPYLSFISQLEKEAQVRPWLLEPDTMAIMFEAALEGRQVSSAELMGTSWWQNHSEAQRNWMTLSESDPATAAQLMEAAVIDTRSILEQFGMSTPPDDIVAWLASQVITGNWSQEKYQQQLRAISDPQSGLPVDATLRAMVGGRTLDTIRVHEEKVRAEVARWLGPLYGQWSNDQISYWAGRVRNDPDAMENLVGVLRGQRLSLFPEYENPMLTYEDIAAPWRNVVTSMWGQQLDETDQVFQQVLRFNDMSEASKLLRSEGLKRGVGTITKELETAALDTGGQVRRVF